MTSPGDPGGWIPLPAGWVFREPRVVTRLAQDDALVWFPIPDASGYAGIGMALRNEIDGAREFWLWTDDSCERTARVIRLGYRRYVVELHSEDGCAVVEDPTRSGVGCWVSDDERDVLGHPTVSPARTLSSWVVAESCARMWVGHGRVHDGYVLGRWGGGQPPPGSAD